MSCNNIKVQLNTSNYTVSGGVLSYNGRQGVVVSELGDYVSSQVTNDSGVQGLTVSDALDDLATGIGSNAVEIITHGSDYSNPHQTATNNLINSDSVEFPSSSTQYDVNRSIKSTLDDLVNEIDSKVASVSGSSDITVDNTDPQNPIIGYEPSDPLDYVLVGDNVSLLVNDAAYITIDDVPEPPVYDVAGKEGNVILYKADITDFDGSDYATSAQGLLADTALQGGDNVTSLVNDANYITLGDIPTLTTTDVAEGSNLYYTEARVSANTSVSTNTLHRGLTDNPHNVTASQVGLGNVNNTSDLDKPVSNAVQVELNGKATSAQGVLADSALQPLDNVSELVNDAGYLTSVAAAPVDSVNGKVGVVVLDTDDVLEGTNKYYPSADSTKLLGIEPLAQVNTINIGDNVSDLVNDVGYLTSVPIGYLQAGDNVSSLVNDSNYITIGDVPSAPVDSVNGYFGVVVLDKGDIGLSNVDNTSDLSKPVSDATQTALDGKLSSVTTDGSLTGDGTLGSPLSVVATQPVISYGELCRSTTGSQKFDQSGSVAEWNSSGVYHNISLSTVANTITVLYDGDYLVNFGGSAFSKRNETYTFYVRVNGGTPMPMGNYYNTVDNTIEPFNFSKILTLTVGDVLDIFIDCEANKEWYLDIGSCFRVQKIG